MTPEQTRYVEKVTSDPLWFIENHLHIVPKKGGKAIPFRLNDEQLHVLRDVFWPKWKAKEPVRIINLKARQLGMSTLFEALAYWLCSTRAFTQGLVVAHEKGSAAHILKMAQLYAQLDGRRAHDLMPAMSHNSKTELTFDNEDWRARADNPGLRSSLKIGSAENRNVGHSLSIQAFHGSEVSRWHHQDILTGILNAMPLEGETFAALESTGNGAQGLFYEYWRAAEKGDSGFTPVFLSWKGRSEYRSRLTPKQAERFESTLSGDERRIMDEHGLSLEEMAWRRKKVSEMEGQGRPAEDVFREQFPLTPEEAFVASGKQYFDLGAIMRAEALAKAAHYKEGWVALTKVKSQYRPTSVEFRERKPLDQKRSYVRIWKAPEPGRDYVIGADVAMGVKGGNYSVAYVMDRRTRESVARYRGLVDPDDYADDLEALAWLYNEAFLAPENNSIGMAVARKLAGKYRRICYQVNASKYSQGEPDPEKPGWNTNNANRREMLGNLRQAVRDGSIRTYCEDFLSEAHDFIVPETADGRTLEDKPRAVMHKLDDCVMAMAITLWVNDPIIAGPIRTPKSIDPVETDWQKAALLQDVKNEGKKREKVYDEHMGAYLE